MRYLLFIVRLTSSTFIYFEDDDITKLRNESEKSINLYALCVFENCFILLEDTMNKYIKKDGQQIWFLYEFLETGSNVAFQSGVNATIDFCVKPSELVSWAIGMQRAAFEKQGIIVIQHDGMACNGIYKLEFIVLLGGRSYKYSLEIFNVVRSNSGSQKPEHLQLDMLNDYLETILSTSSI